MISTLQLHDISRPNTYFPVPRGTVCNRRVEDRRIANQEAVDTYPRDELISLFIESYVFLSREILALRLDQCRNTQCSILQEIILASLDILGKQFPGYRVSDCQSSQR